MSTIAERFANYKRIIAQAVITPIVILLVLVGLLVWQIDSLVQAAQWVDHSDQVISQAHLTLQYALDAETGLRGYLITRNPIFLQPYSEAQTAIWPAFNSLQRDVADNPAQVQQVQKMRQGYADWLAVANREVELRDTNDAAFLAYYNTAPGKQKMDSLRSFFAQFVAAEYRLKAERKANEERTTRGVLGSAVFLGLAAGIVLGVLSVRRFMQVSQDYEQALVAAQKTGELLQTTLLSIGDAVLVTDQRGRVTQLNAVAEKMTGWSAKDAIGKPAGEVFTIVNETTRKPVESPVERVIREGLVVGLANHTVLVRPDGTEIPIDDSGAPIRDDEGRLVGVVLVFRDISERKEAEQLMVYAYEKEHRIAEALQQSLLIKPPDTAFANLETKTVYRPARDEAKVGGDYYDLFQLEEGKVALVVGDVSGKGLAAAIRTAELKYTLRGFLREYPQPAVGMSRLNAFICESQALEHSLQPYFLSVTAAVIDTRSGKTQICVAGAEPPLILRANGTVEQAPTTALPLGVDPKAEYAGIEIDLQAPDTLIIATDGVTEARREKNLLGLDGLTRIVQDCGQSASLDEIADCIVKGAEDYAGGNFYDDICLLLARLA